MCVFGKKRENLNTSNWKRHLVTWTIVSNEKLKLLLEALGTWFFNTPKAKKVCMDTDTISYSYPALDAKFYS